MPHPIAGGVEPGTATLNAHPAGLLHRVTPRSTFAACRGVPTDPHAFRSHRHSGALPPHTGSTPARELAYASVGADRRPAQWPGPPELFCLTARPSSIAALFFFNDTATTEIYTLSLHDALPI